MIFFHIAYGATGTVYFPLQGSATAALTTAASGSLTGTTVLWNMDGSAWAVTTNTGTVVGSGIYKVALTAGETTGKIGVINVKSSNTIFEDQVVIYQTYGNPSAAIPFNFGTNEVILRADQTTATVGTVAFVATGTVTTITNSVTAGTALGTVKADVVLWLGTAAAGTQGTAIVNLVANQSTATIGTVAFLATGTVTTITNSVTAGTALGTVNANLVLWLGTAAAGTQGTAIVNLVANQTTATIGTVAFVATGTITTVINSVTATITGTPAVNAVQFLGTAIVGTQGTLTNIGTAGTALGTVAATVAVLTSSRAELSALPGTSADMGTKIDFIFMVTYNTMIQGSGATSTLTLRNGAGTAAIGTRTIIDDGVTLTSTKWA